MREPLNLVIAGVGGQGNIVASRILAEAALQAGLLVTVGETFGASQRGGSVMSHIRLSRLQEYGPLIPAGQAHVVVGLEPVETSRVLARYGRKETDVIVNPRPNYPIAVLAGHLQYPPLPELLESISAAVRSLTVVEGVELAKKAGSAKALNVVMLGALAASDLTPVPVPAYEQAIRDLFPPDTADSNLAAFRLGLSAVRCGG